MLDQLPHKDRLLQISEYEICSHNYYTKNLAIQSLDPLQFYDRKHLYPALLCPFAKISVFFADPAEDPK